MVTEIQTVDQARHLAHRLLGRERATPVVLVSVAAGAERPYVDPEEVAVGVGDYADVVVLPTGPLTWEFQVLMPPMTQVYGGASRVYPVDDAWQQDPYRSPLRFAYGAEDGPAVAEKLVADALGMAVRAGLVTPKPGSAQEVVGEVRGLPLPSRAFVHVSGRFVAVHQELAYPGVPLERVVAKGMRVRGLLDPDVGTLDIRVYATPAREALEPYGVGDVVLVRVREVGDADAQLELHPEVVVTVTRDDVTSNPEDHLTSLFTAGEVVAARVTASGEAAWALRLLDVDDDEEPLPALSLLPGGPPWLVPTPLAEEPVTEVADRWTLPAQEPVREPAVEPAREPAREETPATQPEDAPAPEPAQASRPTPLLLDRRRRARPQPPVPAEDPAVLTPAVGTPGPGRATSPWRTEALALRTQVQELQTDLHRALAEGDELRQRSRAFEAEHAMLKSHVGILERDLRRTQDDLERQRTRLRKEVTRRGRGGRGGEGASPPDPAFIDPEEQLRHEVYVAWAQRIPASDKPNRPMLAYAVGPDFLGSLDRTRGVDRGKVIDVVVEVVTGIADRAPGRQMHQLRSGEGGSDPAVVRERDGATCWRVNLQSNVAQARRMHFWRIGDHLEFSRVVLHDDHTP